MSEAFTTQSYAGLENHSKVFVHTTKATGEPGIETVSGYGQVLAAPPETDEGDLTVTIEMWEPGLWAKLGERVFWSGDDDDDDEWEMAGRTPSIVGVPRRDVFPIEDVGTDLDPGCERPNQAHREEACDA